MHRKLVFGLALTLGVALSASAWIPEAEVPQTRASEDLGLASVDTSQEALEAILSRRDARDVLAKMAGDDQADLAARGWAIVGLTRLPAGADTDLALEQLRDNSGHPRLVRNWAAAARLQRADDLNEVFGQASYLSQFPSLNRPFNLRVQAEIANVRSADQLLRMAATQPQLNATVGPRILALPETELAAAMYGRGDDQTRRMAAAYAATKATQGDQKAMAQATIDALRFDGDTPPWMGGALYVPSLGWTGPQAKSLVSELVRWSLYCADRPDLQAERQQIANNLASVGLLRTAGFRNGMPQDPVQMVQRYGEVMGRPAARALLVDLQLSDDTRFAGLSR